MKGSSYCNYLEQTQFHASKRVDKLQEMSDEKEKELNDLGNEDYSKKTELEAEKRAIDKELADAEKEKFEYQQRLEVEEQREPLPDRKENDYCAGMLSREAEKATLESERSEIQYEKAVQIKEEEQSKLMATNHEPLKMTTRLYAHEESLSKDKAHYKLEKELRAQDAYNDVKQEKDNEIECEHEKQNENLQENEFYQQR